MKEVFISYSTVDTVQAETVRNILEKNGISCWMAPRDIPGGSNYTKEIPIAIRGCKAFVLILSDHAQSSQWVLRELDSAVNCGKVILPFMLEDCTLNDEFNFLLTGAQRYAAYQKKAEALEKLVSRVRGVLEADRSGVQADAEESAEPAQEQPAEQEVKKPIIKIPTPKQAKQEVSFMATCPACGGTELKLLPHKIVKRDFVEFLLSLIGIPLAIVIGYVALFITFYESFSTQEGAGLCGIAAGLVLGAIISRRLIRNRRLRMRKKVECYRCNRCKKVFNHVEELD